MQTNEYSKFKKMFENDSRQNRLWFVCKNHMRINESCVKNRMDQIKHVQESYEDQNSCEIF